MTDELLMWGGFNALIVLLLVIDLGLLSRREREVGFKESLLWSGVWTGIALVFNLVMWHTWPTGEAAGGIKSGDAALQFFTGYLIERALSVDNLFVFVIIFAYFKVPKRLQNQVLFWGIIGALVLRGLFIFGGAALIHAFSWTLYAFGALLVFSGIKLALQKETQIDPSKNPGLILMRKLMPVSDEYHGKSYFIRRNARLVATPLAAVLAVVAVSDIVFAIDSIPAVFAITNHTFLVYASNIFAVLGLRPLYFLVAELVQLFHFLHYGLSLVLIFVGAKMLFKDQVHMNVAVSLFIVFGLLGGSIIASMIWPEKKKAVDED